MPDIHQAVLIGADSEKVFDALTQQQGVAGWWTPEAQIRPDLNSTARFPFGPDYFKEMIITALKPAEFVQWDCIHGADEWVGTTISFRLIPGSKASLLKSYPEIRGQIEQQSNDIVTLLIFRHDNWKGFTLMFAECSYTWAQFLKSLKLYCETGLGMPWPDQHRTVKSKMP